MSKSQSIIREKLRQQLLTLPFDAYAQVIARLLLNLGYQEVQLAGRTDWKGRNHSGGSDLVATLPGGLTPRRVVIQLKQFDRHSRIFQRHIDELCGVAIRSRASEAVLLTTGPLSPSIKTEALVSPLLPIRLIEGEQLLTHLIQQGIGVLPGGEAVDLELFNRLRQSATGNSRLHSPKQIHTSKQTQGRPAEVTVRVEVLAPHQK